MKLQAQQQIEQQKTQNNVQQAQFEAQTQAQLKQFEIEKQAELKRFEIEQDAMLEKYKIDKQVEADLLKAQIAAGAQIRSAYKTQTGKEDMPEEEDEKRRVQEERENSRDMSLQEIRAMVGEMIEDARSPATLVRDGAGRVAAVQKGRRTRRVIRGPDGRAQGVE
jgi:hypothetical protein